MDFCDAFGNHFTGVDKCRVGSCVGSFYATLTDICGTLVALTASLVRVIDHLANDYRDFVHGADLMDKVKFLSAVQSGLVTLIQVEKVLQWLAGAGGGVWNNTITTSPSCHAWVW